MNRQNIATTIVLLLSSLVFAVVGSSYMNYVYKETKIVVEDPKVYVSSGVLVYEPDDQEKQQIETLKLSDSELGLKPTTGDQDSETKIPSTVTNKNGSEGLYASVRVTSQSAGLKIVVKNIKVESDIDQEKIKKERENIFIAVMDQEDGAKSFDAEEIVLVQESAQVTDKEYIILFWLDAKAGNDLVGVKISFTLHFIV